MTRKLKSLKETFLNRNKTAVDSAPLNNIEESLNKNKERKKRTPWITREIVLVDEKGRIVRRKEKKADQVKYLEMSVPLATADSAIYEEHGEFTRSTLKEFTSRNDAVITEIPVAIPVTVSGAETIEAPAIEPPAEDPFEEFQALEDETEAPVEMTAEDVDISCMEDEYEDDIPVQNYTELEEAETRKDEDVVTNRIFAIQDNDETPEPETVSTAEIEETEAETVDRNKIDMARDEKRVFDEIPINRDYIIPTRFLQSSKPADTESWKNEIRRNSTLLVNTLADFGIESKVVAVNRGPVITLYELQIAPGIKVNRIVGLSDDIAMALAASRVRVVAPIPGKSAVGVEIPNSLRENVTLGDIIKTEEYRSRSGYLKVAMGKDILGKPLTLDLKRLPHLLIAGATGSGKSVCVNTIISSLIYNYDPNYVRFIMVDPKMVELQVYNGLPHLLTPVITEPALTPAILKWAIYEMERRYRMLSLISTRDVERYNEKIRQSKDGGERLPYIVIIIDELADLMMVASKEIEGYITRLAQKARAVGIHLVLATQRPSVDVITGIIKANFPARIAFQVAQKTDSRTIIDQNGAEKLLGKGDMLYQSPMSSFPVRIQGAFISEDEIAEIVEHLEIYGEPCYIDIEQSLFDAAEDERDGDENEDELFVEALKIVEETRKASASYLQRRLSIGYNRAARIIELMENRGYVGPQQGSKPRDVFI